MSGSLSASSWQTVRLGDVAEVIRGIAFPSTDKCFQDGEGLIACLRTTNVQREVEWSDLWFIPRKHVRNERQVIRTGDILISTANSYELVGKVAQVKNPPTEATLGAFISMIRVNAELSPKYIYYQLASSGVQQRIREMASTTTNISNVSTSKLAELDLSIAPKPEQDRIVAEIEKQFTRLDDSVAALKRVQANLKRYRASVLKAACEGRLVPTEAELARKEGRNYEPASELLKRILVERREKWESNQLQKMIAAGKPPKDEWKKKYKEPEAPEAADLPNLPEGWVWATLEQVSHLIRNGISTKPNQEKGLPILRISAVRPLSVDLDDVRFLTPSDEFREFKLCENDLLFTRYNGNREYVGVCGRVKQLPGGLVHPDKLIRVVPIRAGLAPWVEIVSNVGFPRAFLNKRIRTTAGQSGVSGEDLKQLPIPLCPESEATRIATEVDRALTTIQAIGRSFEANVTRATQVRNSVLHKSFSGKLVPHDPNDEPASVLLERIRAERSHGKPVRAWVDGTGTLRTQGFQDSCETCGTRENISSCSACEVSRCERHLYGVNRLCTECSNSEEAWSQDDTALQYAAAIAFTHPPDTIETVDS